MNQTQDPANTDPWESFANFHLKDPVLMHSNLAIIKPSKNTSYLRI